MKLVSTGGTFSLFSAQVTAIADDNHMVLLLVPNKLKTHEVLCSGGFFFQGKGEEILGISFLFLHQHDM